MSKGVKTLCGLMVVALLMIGLPVSKTAGAQGSVGSEKRPGGGPGSGEQPRDQFVAGRLLVKFREGVRPERAQEAIAAHGARSTDEIANIGVHVLQLPDGASEQATLHAFQSRPEVEFAELDRIVAPAEIYPNDPWYVNTEWHLRRISAPTAWGGTTGNPNIIIAILDSGVNSSHEDLVSNLIPGWNIYSGNSNTTDLRGHGTMVSGTAAALSNNGIGVASVAWNCRVMPVRISDANGFASYSTMAGGINWAADHGARVANLSFKGVDGSTVTSAAKYFQQKGGIVVAAAGNDAAFSTAADNPYIITVSATDTQDALYSWSNRGNNIDLSAPGYVYSTNLEGGYSNGAGTSFSAPIVAGVAALALSVNPGLTGLQLQDILKQSADDLGPAGWDSSYGWGRVNAARAVSMAGGQSTDMTRPSVRFDAPTAGATVSGSVSVQVSGSDNVGVVSLGLSVDGVQQGSVSGTSAYGFPWNTTNAANGSHTLTATARDAAGNTASTTISVNVNNASAPPPTVTITSPSDNSLVSGTVSVSVNVTSSVGVAKVELYVDGRLKSTATSAPYATKWNARREAAGPHTLHCVAYDAAGNTARSQSVTVMR